MEHFSGELWGIVLGTFFWDHFLHFVSYAPIPKTMQEMIPEKGSKENAP